MKSGLVAVLCAAAFLIVGAGSASAGEVTGNGETLWTSTVPCPPGEGPPGAMCHTLNGASICAFSGLNDEYYLDGDRSVSRVQNWGHDKGDTPPRFFNPGDACRVGGHA